MEMSVTDLLAPWQTLDESLGLGAPIRDEEHYKALLAFVDECFERFGDNDAHPIFGLVSLVADRIRDYEDRAHPWPDTSTPQSVLATLMGAHHLTQKDLPEVGAQSVLSEILAGKRQLNLRQVRALAHRFGVPMEMFAA